VVLCVLILFVSMGPAIAIPGTGGDGALPLDLEDSVSSEAAFAVFYLYVVVLPAILVLVVVVVVRRYRRRV